MFVNFTNHPSGSWGAAQRRAAQVYGEILDLPFPDVPPALSARCGGPPWPTSGRRASWPCARPACSARAR